MDLEPAADLTCPFVGGGLEHEWPQKTTWQLNGLYFVQDLIAVKKWGAKQLKGRGSWLAESPKRLSRSDS